VFQRGENQIDDGRNDEMSKDDFSEDAAHRGCIESVNKMPSAKRVRQRLGA
jgi:hypothetical protein